MQKISLSSVSFHFLLTLTKGTDRTLRQITLTKTDKRKHAVPGGKRPIFAVRKLNAPPPPAPTADPDNNNNKIPSKKRKSEEVPSVVPAAKKMKTTKKAAAPTTRSTYQYLIEANTGDRIKRGRQRSDNEIYSKCNFLFVQSIQLSCLTGKIHAEMHALQSQSRPIIPKAPFARLIREITLDFKPDFRWQAVALMALQEGAEAMLTTMMEERNFCAIHGKRVTVMPKDLRLVRTLNK